MAFFEEHFTRLTDIWDGLKFLATSGQTMGLKGWVGCVNLLDPALESSGEEKFLTPENQVGTNMKPLTDFRTVANARINPVIVSGSPRSGTTVSHALICTSKSVNDYVPECSFFTGLLSNFEAGLSNELHNNDLFGGKPDFQEYGIEQISHLLVHLWIRLRTPRYLCLKDPYLAGHFRWLDQVFPKAKFVFTFRCPVETISSRVTVQSKAGVMIDERCIRQLCAELRSYYELGSLLAVRKQSTALLIDYESVLDGSADQAVCDFLGIDDVCRDILWQSEFVRPARKSSTDNEWMTPKYFDRITGQKTDIVLSPDQVEMVEGELKHEYGKLSKLVS